MRIIDKNEHRLVLTDGSIMGVSIFPIIMLGGLALGALYALSQGASTAQLEIIMTLLVFFWGPMALAMMIIFGHTRITIDRTIGRFTIVRHRPFWRRTETIPLSGFDYLFVKAYTGRSAAKRKSYRLMAQFALDSEGKGVPAIWTTRVLGRERSQHMRASTVPLTAHLSAGAQYSVKIIASEVNIWIAHGT